MTAELSSDDSELYRRALAQWHAKDKRGGKLLPELSAQQQLERELQVYRLALEIQRKELKTLEQRLAESALLEQDRLEELRTSARILEASEAFAHVGGVEMDVMTRRIHWTAETYRIHDTTP